MNRLLSLGRYLFAAALVAFAIQHFVYASMGSGLGPPWILGHPLWAWPMGAALLAASASIVMRKYVLIVAGALTALLLIYVELLYGPRFAAGIHNPGPWTSAAELVCIGGASFVLAGRGSSSNFGRRAITVGRLLFALPLIVFAVQHFLYASFIATLIPAWIPLRLFWAYFVGAAFVAAAVSIATKLRGRLGATLLGIMFFIWGGYRPRAEGGSVA